MAATADKYHVHEWHASNKLNYSRAEQERASAEKLEAECERLRKETEATTFRKKQSNDHKFSLRLSEIEFWKKELEEKIAEDVEETKMLNKCKEQLEKALAATRFPLEVAQKCLAFREKRISIDLVHDDVEIQLLKEVEVVQGVQALLQHTFDQTVEQIRRLRSCKYKLEKDLKDKFTALNIDESCAKLHAQSPGIGYSRGAVKIQTNSVSPEQWEGYSNENVIKTEQERNSSTTLRGVIHSVLEQTSQDLARQRAAVNLAFELRIREVTSAKETLEKHLEKVLKEIGAMEDNISKLKQALEAKEGPMQVAQTRLSLRAERPNVELVRDPVQYGLVDEVQLIQESVEKLQEQLSNSESALKGLIRTQLTLEEDIGVKANSLMVDKGQCMELRKQLEISS